MKNSGSRGARNASRKPLAVWLAAEVVYVIAIAGRSSFGVAGLEAMDRFDIAAATLSLFTVVQLGVYSLAQIPAGMLVDRLGVRKVLAGGVPCSWRRARSFWDWRTTFRSPWRPASSSDSVTPPPSCP